MPSVLASLIPEWVQKFLIRDRDRTGARSPVPSDEEIEVIRQLVDMGFSDLSRIRVLYQQFGNDLNEIASRLLDGATE